MSAAAWAVIAGLILVNAFYVAAEFGGVGVRRTRIAALAEQGHYLARLLLPIVEDARLLDRYLSATQIGITLSSLILGAYGQAVLAPALVPTLIARTRVEAGTAESPAAGIVLVVLTIAQVIVGEQVPKSLALQHPTRSALYTVVPMRWSSRALTWFIDGLNATSTLILRLFGLPSLRHRHIHSPEEIDLLIVESRDGGLLEPEEQRRLHRALRLGLRSVRQVMVPRPRVHGIEADTPLDEVVQIVAESPYTRLPVYRGTLDRVVGILHTHDLALLQLRTGSRPGLDQILRPVVTVSETLSADRLLKLFRERRTHQAIVVNEHGATAGLVTLEDVLAELLGDVADELKPAPPREGART
ncbi:MAG: HlyC/CorC family transporter [Acidobacteria bacterium]|nr:HlyC/CorC family transporter [Acidobacteriota bacterium]